jgi:hypothetical protein
VYGCIAGFVARTIIYMLSFHIIRAECRRQIVHSEKYITLYPSKAIEQQLLNEIDFHKPVHSTPKAFGNYSFGQFLECLDFCKQDIRFRAVISCQDEQLAHSNERIQREEGTFKRRGLRRKSYAGLPMDTKLYNVGFEPNIGRDTGENPELQHCETELQVIESREAAARQAAAQEAAAQEAAAQEAAAQEAAAQEAAAPEAAAQEAARQEVEAVRLYESVTIAVMIRPTLACSSSDTGFKTRLEKLDDNTLQCTFRSDNDEMTYPGGAENPVILADMREHTADHVFEVSATNDDVFQKLRPLIRQLSKPKSRNVCLIGDGCSGSGKSDTMCAKDDSIGSKAAAEIFASDPPPAKVTFSAFQTWDKHPVFKMKKLPTGVTMETKMSTVWPKGWPTYQYVPTTAAGLSTLILQLDSFRKSEATRNNDNSSRSHLVCHISITRADGDMSVLYKRAIYKGLKL